MGKVFSSLGALIVSTLPFVANAQLVQLKYIASHEEVIKSKNFCFEIEGSSDGKRCYRLTDFPLTEITKARAISNSVYSAIAPHLNDFEWIEISDFALESNDLSTTAIKIIPFVVRVRWRPKEISLPGIEPGKEPRGIVFAFGLLYLNEFENPDGKRVEMNEYGAEGELPHLAQGLAAQQDVYIFHHTNMTWLQNILNPILLEYLNINESIPVQGLK